MTHLICKNMENVNKQAHRKAAGNWKTHLFPPSLWNEDTTAAFVSLLVSLLTFDVLWCVQMSFTAFQFPLLYVNAAFVSLVLMLPYMLSQSRGLHVVVLVLFDVLLLANLMYCRTYYSAIPLDSYTRMGNLNGFMSAALDQLRWQDICFAVGIIAYIVWCLRTKPERLSSGRWKAWLATVAGVGLVAIVPVACVGGIDKAFQNMKTKHGHTCMPAVYTVFGCMIYDMQHQREVPTEEAKREIDEWMSQRPAYQLLPDSIGKRTNLVIVFCESLESWVLEKRIEGKEITPNLNKLIGETTTLYAPRVLTQAKGGRSIDAQLLLLSGLLPIESGSYAFLYPDNTYPSIVKAMKAERETKSILMTVDKPTIWNQAVVARDFGITDIYAQKQWKSDGQGVGPRKNLADANFFEQATALMDSVVWTANENVFLQLVTYSGHAPFKLPEELRRLKLAGTYPEKLKDYIITANYTDYALGKLMSYLKGLENYERTLVVIVGDHEGLASDRESLCQSAAGRGLVSDKPFTPLIVANSPVSMRYDEVMGQIDIYPTLLNLMHLDHYEWKGLGQSLLDPAKTPAAVAPDLQMEGTCGQLRGEWMTEAYAVSDRLIRYNYFADE